MCSQNVVVPCLFCRPSEEDGSLAECNLEILCVPAEYNKYPETAALYAIRALEFPDHRNNDGAAV
jgi:hypothetical protein